MAISFVSHLHNALVHPSSEIELLPIWIDAICINAEDTSEKSTEVQEMENIQRAAQLVLLGRGKLKQSGMRLLPFLGSQVAVTPAALMCKNAGTCSPLCFPARLEEIAKPVDTVILVLEWPC